jgi:membrane protein implicated in regulation of membrane protease activity
MSWWGWVVAGAILLGAELTVINAQFYLVFVGVAAIVVGMVTAATPNLVPWAHWAGFAILAFRNRLYQWLRGHPPEVATGPTGAVVTLPTALAPGDCCQVEHGGSFWTARNDSDAPIPAGGRARIAHVRGLTLLVRPDR